MRISLIAAMDTNRLIGSDNAMPWHLPRDLKHFKTITLGHSVVMGRKTLESIGRPLPKRTNIVLTTQQDFAAEGCLVAGSIDEALAMASPRDEVMIIGGASVYEQFMPRAARLYLTLIDGVFAGDRYFPDFEGGGWLETERIEVAADNANPHACAFVTLDRRLA